MKKSGLIFVILFSLLIIGGVELECYENEKYYRYIEETFIENYNFVQNGVKLEYIANEGIAEEKSRIIEFIKNNITNDIEVNNSSINFCDDSLSYGINLIDIGSTKVEVTIINNSSDIKSLDLRQAVERLKNNKCIDDRIYYFSKLKINEDKNTTSFILDKINEDTIEEVQISNGKVFKAQFIDGSKINIGQISYNTGTYIIIGTPVIFITY